jgi:hypothetical protein
VPEWLRELDDEVLRALGGTDLVSLDLGGWARLLDALPAGRPVAPADAIAVWHALAALATPLSASPSVTSEGTGVRAPVPSDGAEEEAEEEGDVAGGVPDWSVPDRGVAGARDEGAGWARGGVPEHVVALVAPDRAAVVHAEDAAVADAPMWRQRTDVAAIVAVPETADAAAVADMLDLPLTSELADGDVTGDGARRPVPEAVCALLGPAAPATWWEHDELRVDSVEVEWWVDGDGVHAATVAGLAAGLAQAAWQWPRRWAVEVVLSDEGRVGEVQLSD